MQVTFQSARLGQDNHGELHSWIAINNVPHAIVLLSDGTFIHVDIKTVTVHREVELPYFDMEDTLKRLRECLSRVGADCCMDKSLFEGGGPIDMYMPHSNQETMDGFWQEVEKEFEIALPSSDERPHLITSLPVFMAHQLRKQGVVI